MKTALDTLADLSGLSLETMNSILEQVRSNHARLNACQRHEFLPIAPIVVVGQRYRCSCCSGEVDQHQWYWHQQGRR